MDEELIKQGGRRPGRPKKSETVVQEHDVRQEASPASLPLPQGMASLDEDNQRYAKEKAIANWDVDAMFQQYTTMQHQGILPNIPKDPEFGYCWVTTNKTFPDNNIARKLQGWHECSWEDVEHLGISPGNINTNRAAEIGDDLVSVQEMVLMRIPSALRDRILKHNHHDEPTMREENLYAQTRAMLRGNRGQNVMLENESDSKLSLAAKNHKPNFNGV